MGEFFEQVFRVAWSIFNFPIPITSKVSVSPWQIALFSAAVGLLLKYLFNKGQES